MSDQQIVKPRRRLMSFSSSRIERVVPGPARWWLHHTAILWDCWLSTGNRHTLFLPTGKIRRVAICLSPRPTNDSNSVTRRLISSSVCCPAPAAEPRCQKQYAKKQVKMLENHTNLATSFGQLGSDSVVNSWPSTSTLPSVGRSAGLHNV